MDIEIAKQNNTRKWLLATVIIFFIVVLIIASLYLFFENKYGNKIYPGVFIGKIDLSGATKEEAKKILNNKINNLNQNGIIFRYDGKAAAVLPIVSSLESDLAYQVINFDVDKTVNGAYNVGREGKFFRKLKDKIHALASKKIINMATGLNEDEIVKILKEKFSALEIPAQNAHLAFVEQKLPDGGIDYIFNIEEEKAGKTIDYSNGINRLKNNLSAMVFDAIELSSGDENPQIYKKDCLGLENKAKEMLLIAPFTLKYGDKNWEIKKNQLAGWLEINIYPENFNDAAAAEKIIAVGLNKTKAEEFLTNEVAKEINKAPIEARFEINNGRVTEFQGGKNGFELDVPENILKIDSLLADSTGSSTKEIELVVKEIEGSVSVGNINDLGIKEIIGTGQSNFSGSPANRRHNIKTGANSLNGVLIKPGEEFSLLAALGTIDGSTGYLQELVIKDNKTTPEYGGGLCQIGTTVFRAALASGLPITTRRNHSYRVSYYEPAGTDATIYSPWPDFKFVNDTGSYILIQIRFNGDDLFFDFWGTKDGRVVKKTEPTIYNIVRPGPTKIIETLDLKPGEKKCTERAHNGADAYFDYKVTYAAGSGTGSGACAESQDENNSSCESTEALQAKAWDKISNGVKEKRFSSHYVPWREVCLLGVEKLSEAEKTDNAEGEKGSIGETDANVETATEEKIN